MYESLPKPFTPGKANVAELKATIEEETSSIGALETKIEELSSDIQTDEADHQLY